MIINKVASHTTPLCFLSDGRLLCYHRQNVLVKRGEVVDKKISVLVSIKESLLGWSKALSRLFRLGIRVAEPLNDNQVLLWVGNKLCELDVVSGEMTKGWFGGSGIRPLTMTSIAGLNGFADGVYFGGYLSNGKKKPVNIYHRIGVDQWEVVYTFPQGVMNHIHNIIVDPYRNCLWVFSGDFGDASAIWKVTDGFGKVERFVNGDQKWRGCVAFAVPEGVLYATDAPYAKNHIYLLKENKSVTRIADLGGSCIYGCQWKDKFVFSTAVEADGRNETLLRLLFGWKRGAGIEDRNVHIHLGNMMEGFHDVYEEKKDLWPFIFQFGAIRFPSGVNNSDSLFFQPVATKSNDLRLMEMKGV